MTSPGPAFSTRIAIDRALAEFLPAEDAEPKVLHRAMRYSCLAPGKRVRPLLCLAAARAVGGDEERALPAACAVEMVHAFSLIHDDLPAIDDDDLRRGQATCHKVFGEAVAILAGDALFALAFRILATVPVAADRVTACIIELATQTGSDGVVGGEVMDILAEGEPPDLSGVQEIHRRKTGSLMGAACTIGGLVGGGTPDAVALLRSYGVDLGLAFQIIDDVLNETSNPEALGKAAGSDRALGKATYPSLMGLDAARDEAKRIRDRAVASLSGLPGDTAALHELALFSVEREA